MILLNILNKMNHDEQIILTNKLDETLQTSSVYHLSSNERKFLLEEVLNISQQISDIQSDTLISIKLDCL